MTDSPTDVMPMVLVRYSLITGQPLSVLHVIVCKLCHGLIPADEHAGHWSWHAAAALLGTEADFPPWFANATVPPPASDSEALGPQSAGITAHIPEPRDGRHSE